MRVHTMPITCRWSGLTDICKSLCFICSDPCQMQDAWKLSEGFVAEEAKALLPHRATGRYKEFFMVKK